MPVNYEFRVAGTPAGCCGRASLVEVDNWICERINELPTDTNYGYVHIAALFGTSILLRAQRLDPKIYCLDHKTKKITEDFLLNKAEEALKDGRWETPDQALNWVLTLTEAFCTKWNFSAWR